VNPANRDADGYVDLRSYAAIGDTRTVALIAGDGSVDWLPLPDLHSLPVFARLLDGDGGGSFQLCPTSPHQARREYEDGTNVLATTYTTETGTVRVTDALTVGVTGPLPWSELVRLVDGVTGRVEMAWQVSPGTGLNTVSPWVQEVGDGAVLRMDAITMALRTAEVGAITFDDRAASGRFTASAVPVTCSPWCPAAASRCGCRRYAASRRTSTTPGGSGGGGADSSPTTGRGEPRRCAACWHSSS